MRYLFFGAGGAGVGIAEMCVKQMESEGMDTKEAQERIFLMDSQGLVVKKRWVFECFGHFMEFLTDPKLCIYNISYIS